MAVEIPSVTMTLVEHLREEIVTGKLRPGQKLNEIELSSAFGVSRPPLREAFRILMHDRLVVNVPRKGTYVTQLSMEDLHDLYEARKMIESYAIDILEAKDIRDLPSVALALAKVSNLSIPPGAELQQLSAYKDVFRDYHVRLVESAGNARLIDFYQSIYFCLARYENMHFSIVEGSRRSLEEHERILNLIELGDYHQAKEWS